MQFTRFISLDSSKPEAVPRGPRSEALTRLTYHQECSHAVLGSVQLFCGLVLAVRLQRRFLPRVGRLIFFSPIFEALLALAYLGSSLNGIVSRHYGTWFEGSHEAVQARQDMRQALQRHQLKFLTDSQYWH
jgi:hypothetical protein